MEVKREGEYLKLNTQKNTQRNPKKTVNNFFWQTTFLTLFAKPNR